MIGTTEAIIIGGVVLLLFGAKKLPELARSMGKSKAAFDEGIKEGMSSEEDEVRKLHPLAPDYEETVEKEGMSSEEDEDENSKN